MQKRLPDYFHLLVDRKDILTEYYEPEAFMFSEEAIVLAGQLIGLNIIDSNGWCVREEDLDFQPNVVDLRNYVKVGLRFSTDGDE